VCTHDYYFVAGSRDSPLLPVFPALKSETLASSFSENAHISNLCFSLLMPIISCSALNVLFIFRWLVLDLRVYVVILNGCYGFPEANGLCGWR
jgi:hypothetical protein